MKRPGSVKSLEDLGRVRLSENFFMRDFLYSEVANLYGVPNIPDDPDLAIETGPGALRKPAGAAPEEIRAHLDPLGLSQSRGGAGVQRAGAQLRQAGDANTPSTSGTGATPEGIRRRDGDGDRARLHPLLPAHRALGGDGVVGARPPALFVDAVLSEIFGLQSRLARGPEAAHQELHPAAARFADQARHAQPCRLARATNIPSFCCR